MKLALNNEDEFKLLSINKVSKLLGVRYETAKQLVYTEKIKGVTLNKKVKVPYKNLFEFINEKNNSSSLETGIISIEETQNKIDLLIKKQME